ncbi:nucleoside-diphosphate-sugar epimerase family protein [Saccharata proteae CBS 121410]|uniref:Nucleoside-diphosphate-sugar epimerase family protein n=1 Tax=Saccharata proteae CBS 121410 TaxID=1314787 RepID=A0A9P4I4F9_9PEZI|nr:nucleoside-diphosphate-sugar epimerase family protein [Saccharata proteae CBS 121410]
MATAILVTGATGKQGGATLDALVKANSNVIIIAVTRNPESQAAKALASKSPKVKVIKGEMNEPNTMLKAAEQAAGQPIWGVFSVQAPSGPDGSIDVELEEVQGKGLVDAALAASVKHFVYASVGRRSSSDATNVPHFASKHHIEQHLISATAAKPGAMTWTILQPVAFLDNGAAGPFSGAFFSMWKVALPAKPLQVVATTDIGKVAASSFLEPEKHAGKMIPLAGDEITFEQLGQVFEQKTGDKLPSVLDEVARGILAQSADMAAMWKWFGDVGFGVDIGAVNNEVSGGMTGYGKWLEENSGYKMA